ncbi:hypothetical protein ACJX0J_029116, partial [Zea mays]
MTPKLETCHGDDITFLDALQDLITKARSQNLHQRLGVLSDLQGKGVTTKLSRRPNIYRKRKKAYQTTPTVPLQIETLGSENTGAKNVGGGSSHILGLKVNVIALKLMLPTTDQVAFFKVADAEVGIWAQLDTMGNGTFIGAWKAYDCAWKAYVLV